MVNLKEASICINNQYFPIDEPVFEGRLILTSYIDIRLCFGYTFIYQKRRRAADDQLSDASCSNV